jgi:hypothetical protein
MLKIECLFDFSCEEIAKWRSGQCGTVGFSNNEVYQSHSGPGHFFGSSSTAKFRANFLDDLLRNYHTKLIQDLENFGYKNSVYPLEHFLADFEDTWLFGFIIGCYHMQVSSNNSPGKQNKTKQNKTNHTYLIISDCDPWRVL